MMVLPIEPLWSGNVHPLRLAFRRKWACQPGSLSCSDYGRIVSWLGGRCSQVPENLYGHLTHGHRFGTISAVSTSENNHRVKGMADTFRASPERVSGVIRIVRHQHRWLGESDHTDLWRGPTMTENERRAQDTLNRSDIVRRIALCGGMIASFLTALLVFTP